MKIILMNEAGFTPALFSLSERLPASDLFDRLRSPSSEGDLFISSY